MIPYFESIDIYFEPGPTTSGRAFVSGLLFTLPETGFYEFKFTVQDQIQTVVNYTSRVEQNWEMWLDKVPTGQIPGRPGGWPFYGYNRDRPVSETGGPGLGVVTINNFIADGWTPATTGGVNPEGPPGYPDGFEQEEPTPLDAGPYTMSVVMSTNNVAHLAGISGHVEIRNSVGRMFI